MAAHSQATEQPAAAAKGGMHVETWIFVALTVFFVVAVHPGAVRIAGSRCHRLPAVVADGHRCRVPVLGDQRADLRVSPAARTPLTQVVDHRRPRRDSCWQQSPGAVVRTPANEGVGGEPPQPLIDPQAPRMSAAASTPSTAVTGVAGGRRTNHTFGGGRGRFRRRRGGGTGGGRRTPRPPLRTAEAG